MATRLIFGCGYLGHRVAERWSAAGDQIFVVTRSVAKAREFAARGWQPIVADVTRPESLSDLPIADTLLFAVGFDRRTPQSIHDVYVGGLGNALNHTRLTADGRLVYISSTGVYSQDDGQWVDEDSPCHPRRDGGRACLAAEQLLADHPLATRSFVLRMAGIYGPGRIPRQADLLAGKPIPAIADGYLNLIHGDDAAGIVLAALAAAQPPRTYLVADGHPVIRSEYYNELARLSGAPAPIYSTPPADSPQAIRAQADKRISTARLQAEIAYAFNYPSYIEGLAAILRG